MDALRGAEIRHIHEDHARRRRDRFSPKNPDRRCSGQRADSPRTHGHVRRRTGTSVIHPGQRFPESRNDVLTQLWLEPIDQTHELPNIRNVSDRARCRQAEDVSKCAGPVRREIYGGSPPAYGKRGDDRFFLSTASVVQRHDTFETQKINRIEDNIRLADEVGGILWCHPLIDGADRRRRIDRQETSSQRVDFLCADISGCEILSIQVVRFDLILINQGQMLKSQPHAGLGNCASDAASGYQQPGLPNQRLQVFRDVAGIA